MDEYEKAYEESIDNPRSFWADAAEDIEWYEKWDQVLDESNKPFYRWFSGGKLNTCYNAVDHHIENGRGDQDAIIYDSPVTDTIEKYSFEELKERVSKIAGFLRELGVEKGDTVVIYMPMIPESLMSMLACARIGAVHSVVFGGFAANELAIRVDDAEPDVILSASCGIERDKVIEYKPLLDEAIELAENKPTKCVIKQRPEYEGELIEGRDYDWEELEEEADPANCVSVGANDPLYVLYTSGTTGKPKGVVRDNGGHSVALKWSMRNVYGIEPGDVYWAASDVGWVVGHSYIVYAPLLIGATTVMYEGKPVGTPDPGAFWRVISQHDVDVLFTAPTAIRAVKREDPDAEYFEDYDVSGLDSLFLAGERTDPDTYHWVSDLLQVPVIDHWWQTETGWPIVGNFRGLEQFPIKPGSATKPMPGYDLQILDPQTGEELPPGETGVIAIKLPLPPGTFITLWNNKEKFKQEYMDPFPGYYFTGDAGFVDEDGYISIMGRVDNVINVAGHRLSTGSMEEAVAKHPAVAECAVVGINDELKGEVPMGFLVLKSGVEQDHEEIKSKVIQIVRDEVGPIASFKKALIVDELPKTRSGKTLRGTMKKIADGEEYNVPSTIADEEALGTIEEAIEEEGLEK
ncbi:MAG: propionyl-CoA synthetase [Candidatus Thermoplasmatota archaeon]|nr:propionyl-CoA synthetase [Candidatus Thermoplasmatota archaeon]